MKIKKNIQTVICVSKRKCCKEKDVDLLLIGEEERNTMFLSMVSIDSCMIIHYIEKENIFVFIFYTLSLQKKFQSVILNIALKLMIKKGLKCLRKVNVLNSKIL